MIVVEGKDKIKIGDAVSTPDGEGKVTAFDSRFVDVELKDKKAGKFYHKELVKK